MTQQAFLICLIGIDGSGKTTQAHLLVDWLIARGVKSTYAWSRGEVQSIRNAFLVIGRRVLGTSAQEISSDKNTFRQYQARKSILMKYSLVRMLWSSMTYVEHIFQINKEIRVKLRDGWVVVCDRYMWDSSIDMAVLNNKKPEWLSCWINRLFRKLIPHPTITLLIDIPPDEALRRKNDIPSLEYVKTRAVLYRYLAENYPLTVIDGCNDVANVQNKIIDTVNIYLEG
jgi:thymidylate kinase